MKKFKSIIAVVLAAVLLFAFAACSFPALLQAVKQQPKPLTLPLTR